ncbi:uncharacterized protein LOC119310544 [Triticum dicoccoides]|nr:uncharacterized protein LOC119310544 [Triticum dicoccoides]
MSCWDKFWDKSCEEPREKLVEDTRWAEVEMANSYALFMGYLSMAVKGLGFLVLTWTTVVLLGGFIDDLHNNDFWCLTFITLVQTAGIFDVFLTEKLSYIGDAFDGVAYVGYAGTSENKWRIVLSMVHTLVFVILLCPLVAVYMGGLVVSAVLSVWRLIQQDYHADGVRNLKKALVVLYSLVLLQVVIFCYKIINGWAKGSIVNAVVDQRGFDKDFRDGISDYIRETMMRCEKDPSLVKGRNLITYAVGLMESKSPDDYISGVRILDAFAKKLEAEVKGVNGEVHYPHKYTGENILKKHLIMSAPSPDILQKLLQTLGRISIYDRETRGRAARVVASIAHDIHLEKYPKAIGYISSLLDTFEEYCIFQPYTGDWLYETYEQDSKQISLSVNQDDIVEQGDYDARVARTYKMLLKAERSDDDLLQGYKTLVEQGLRILQKLAANNDNCRVMFGTPYLLPKIMVPVTSGLLHHRNEDGRMKHIDNAACYSIVEGSMKVIAQLTAATGHIGTKLRDEISCSMELITAMRTILECKECNEMLQKIAIWILTHLHQDENSSPGHEGTQEFITMLVDIMTQDKNYKEATRVVAAKALVALSSGSARIIMGSNNNVIHSLTRLIVEKQRCSQMATEILENLCIHCNDDVQSLKTLKEAMPIVVPKLLEEILFWPTEERHIGGTEVNRLIPEPNVENQCDNSPDNGQANNNSSSAQQQGYSSFRMLSRCVTIWGALISADQDLTHLFTVVPPGGGGISFVMKLKEIVEKHEHHRPVCLRIRKLVCKMVISMMNPKGSYVNDGLTSLMAALSSASDDMFILDGYMVLGQRPVRSLASLVEEARVLVDRNKELFQSQTHVERRRYM